MRILLVGAVVFLAAWFTVLRPKAEEVPPATTPATSSVPTTTPSTSPATKPESATTTAPDPKPADAPVIPDEALAKLPKDVAGALEQRKVLVLGVIADGETDYRPLADDDRYVRNALREVNRYDGGVFVKTVGISELADYGGMINDLGVKQTPSVVVVDGNLKGRVLTGYVDRIAVNQVIADARDAGAEPDVTDAFHRDVSAICGDYKLNAARWSFPTIRGKKPLADAYKRAEVKIASFRRQVAALDAPREHRALKAQWVKLLESGEKRAAALMKAAKTSTLSDDIAADGLWSVREARKLDRKFDDAGFTNCVDNRRS